MAFARARLIRLALVIFIVGLSAVAVRLPSSVKADSSGSGSFFLDGSGTYIPCTNRFYNDTTGRFDSCVAESITTHQPDDLILVLADCTNCAEPGKTLPWFNSVADQSGLGFTERYSFAENSSLWEWYAFAPQPLTGDNITASIANPDNGMLLLHVFAFAGVDFSTTFDHDPSLPSATPCKPFAPQPVSCSTSFSTSGKDLVVASVSINDMPGCQNLSGYTSYDVGWWTVDYGIVDTAQNSYTFTCSSSSTEYTEPVAIAVDAIMLTTTPSLTYTISWQGYDWDGGNEETLTLNGQFLASLPTTDSPQNGGAWTNFTVSTKMLIPGMNTLTFTHAEWDCGVTDNVANLVVSNGSTIAYANSTSLPLGCGQPLTYTINI
jgi:hypothetical protein